jgi:hypothetical protein
LATLECGTPFTMVVTEVLMMLPVRSLRTTFLWLFIMDLVISRMVLDVTFVVLVDFFTATTSMTRVMPSVSAEWRADTTRSSRSTASCSSAMAPSPVAPVTVTVKWTA